MPSTNARKDDIVFWQDNELGAPEPAVLIQAFSDIICLEGADGTVNINYDSLPEFIKILKSLKRPS